MNRPPQQYANYSIRPLPGYWVTTRQLALPYCFTCLPLSSCFEPGPSGSTPGLPSGFPGVRACQSCISFGKWYLPLCNRATESAGERAELWHWLWVCGLEAWREQILGEQALSYKALAFWRRLCNHQVEGRTVSFKTLCRPRGCLQKWGFKVLDCGEFSFWDIPVFSCCMFSLLVSPRLWHGSARLRT